MLVKMLTTLTILLIIVPKTLSQCDTDHSVELTNQSYNGVKYNVGEYFVDNVTSVERGCVCMKETCARKCCPLGQGYHRKKKRCINITNEFNPPVWKENQQMQGFNTTKEFHFLYGKMNCSTELQEIRILAKYSDDEDLHLGTDGQLYLHVLGDTTDVLIYGPDKYCIDTFLSDTAQESTLNALTCYVAKPAEKNNVLRIIFCQLITCFFILVTVVVYTWLPELRTLHGMVLIAYLLSCFMAFLLVGIMFILYLSEEHTRDVCVVMTFMIYFFVQSASFWLNVMCYDIWWTFSRNRAHGRERSIMQLFIYYAIYAFGVPTALTIILAVLEFSELPIHDALLPKLRIQGCFLEGNSKLLYLEGPIMIVYIGNMTFYTLTAIKIWKVKKEINKALRNEGSSTNDQNRKDTQRFTLYVKLFIMMGINRTFEVFVSFYPHSDFLDYCSEAYDALFGLATFIIFVCNKKTFNLIKKRTVTLRSLSTENYTL